MLAKDHVCLLFLPSKWRIGRRLMWWKEGEGEGNQGKEKEKLKKKKERERKEFREDNSWGREENQKGVLSQFSSFCCSLSSLLNTNFLGFLFFFCYCCLLNKPPKREREMEETTNKRDRWPTGLFDCCSGSNSFLFFFFSFFYFSMCFCVFIILKEEREEGVWWLIKSKTFHSFFSLQNSLFFVFKKGGARLCLWGFLCPLCLQSQGWTYSDNLSYSSSKRPLTESQFERYPPWSCRGICSSFSDLDCPNFIWAVICSCCCLFGFAVGCGRHEKYSQRVNFEYYCSSQPCCCCCRSCCDDLSIEDCLIGHFCCCCSIIQVTMAMDEHFRMQSKVEGNVNIKRAH